MSFFPISNNVAFVQGVQLTAEGPLSAAAAAFSRTSGSLEEQLAAAIRAACHSFLQPEPEVPLPEDLDRLGKADMQRFAHAHDIYMPWSLTVADMRAFLRLEARRRRDLNELYRSANGLPGDPAAA